MRILHINVPATVTGDCVEIDLPRVGHSVVLLFEAVGHIDTRRVVVLAEPQTSRSCEPADELVAGATLDVVGASDKLGLLNVHCDAKVFLSFPFR